MGDGVDLALSIRAQLATAEDVIQAAQRIDHQLRHTSPGDDALHEAPARWEAATGRT